MTLQIVNFSDIHFTSGNNPIMGKKSQIVGAINNHIDINDGVLFIVSGDTAYGGDGEQYKKATNFFKYILKKVKNSNILFIPGNHDCNFSKEYDLRNMLIHGIKGGANSVNKLLSNDDLVDKVVEPQSDYLKFVESFKVYNSNLKKIKSGRIIESYEYFNSDEIMNITLFNTAWDSDINENPGSMMMPYSHKGDFDDFSTAMLNLSVLHHPLHWLTPDNKREFQKSIESQSDWIITGHEHVESNAKMIDSSGEMIFTEADVLQDSEDANNSGFNIFKVEKSSEKTIKIMEQNFHWVRSMREYQPEEIKEQIINKNKIFSGKNKIQVNESFKDFIDNLGAPIEHGIKKDLSLDDIFVYPEFRNRFTDTNKRVDSEDILDDIYLNHNRVVFIEGTKESGKTTLLRKIFKISLDKKIIPLVLDSNIEARELNDINKLLSKNYNHEYKDLSFESFLQYESERKIVIVDDWNQINLNSVGKRKLVEELRKKFSNIIVLSNEVPKNNTDIIEIKENLNLDIEYYSIQQFGNKKREELIDKWVRLGKNPLSIDEAKNVVEVDELQRQVKEILGKSYIPQVPIYILIILQGLDKGSNVRELSNQTNGFYYELLIKTSLSQGDIQPKESATFYNYLTELSYSLFEKGITYFNFKYWNDFHMHHTLKYDLDSRTESFEYYFKILKSSNLIHRIDDDHFEFAYPYIYYYFVAQYFADHISEDDIKQKIELLVKNLDIVMNADIIIFLVHLSKEKFILDTVINQSNNILRNVPVLMMQDDIGTLNELMTTLPEIVVANTEFRKSRKEYNEVQDRIEDEEHALENKNNGKDEIVSKPPEVIDMDKAYNISEIIGQILKDYSGIIERDKKLELVQCAYDVSLRAGSQMLSIISKERDNLISFVVNKIDDSLSSKKNDKQKLESMAKKVIFNFCEMVCFAIVRKAVKDTGTRALKPTYDRIWINNESIAKRLIVAGTDIEIFYKHPQDGYVLKLFKETKNNSLAHVILRDMVIQFVSLFPLSTSEKQQISSNFEIKYNVAEFEKRKNEIIG